MRAVRRGAWEGGKRDFESGSGSASAFGSAGSAWVSVWVLASGEVLGEVAGCLRIWVMVDGGEKGEMAGCLIGTMKVGEGSEGVERREGMVVLRERS